MPALLALLGRLLLSDDTGGGAGGGDAPPRSRATDVLERYNGDAVRIAEKLSERENDNYDLREKNRQLKQELETAKKQLIPEGATVLTGEEAKAWAAYRQLGKPDELKTALTERETATSELAGLKRTEAVRAAAEAEGLNAAALLALSNLPPVIVKDVTEGDKTVKRAFVQGENNQETPLTAYGQQHYAALWPAVTATGGAGDGKGGKDKAPPRIPQQPAAGGNDKPAPVGRQVVSRMYALPGRDKKKD